MEGVETEGKTGGKTKVEGKTGGEDRKGRGGGERGESSHSIPVSTVLYQQREDMVVLLAGVGGVELCQLTEYGSPEFRGMKEEEEGRGQNKGGRGRRRGREKGRGREEGKRGDNKG